jgi:HEAT repeat protein
MAQKGIQQETRLGLAFTGESPPTQEVATGREALERLLLGVYRKQLTSPSWRVRKKGARGLRLMGEAASDALPLLEKLMDDSDRRVRETASEAVRKIR